LTPCPVTLAACRAREDLSGGSGDVPASAAICSSVSATTSRGVQDCAGVTVMSGGSLRQRFRAVLPGVAGQALRGFGGFDQQSRRRDSNPERADHKEGAILLIRPYQRPQTPRRPQHPPEPHRLRPFRVTNDVTSPQLPVPTPRELAGIADTGDQQSSLGQGVAPPVPKAAKPHLISDDVLAAGALPG